MGLVHFNKKKNSYIVYNNIGINGVTFSIEEDKPQYLVTWMENKYKQKKKRFYIHKYVNEEECFKEAVKFRKEKEMRFNYLID